jgi:alkylation response protein AidB-like acyl-CoA dehydrogenase
MAATSSEAIWDGTPIAADPIVGVLSNARAFGARIAEAATSADENDLLGLVLEQAHRFAAREINSEKIDHEGVIPDNVIDAARHIGLFGLTIPEAYGGVGFSMKAACRVIDEIARVDRSTAIMLGLHAGLGSRPIIDLGSPAVKERFLPAFARGDIIAAFAATEPEAGSDLGAVRTTGTVVGGEIELTGEKCYVTNARWAGCFTVLARTPGYGGARAHSLVVVPRETPGVSLGLEEKKLGIKGSSTASLLLDGARVPLDLVLGEKGRGMEQAYQTLAWGRTVMSAGCVGTARGALDATVAHVTTRRQFGQPIGDFAASRVHVTHMAATLYAMDSLVRWVGEACASGQTVEDVSIAAKVFCSEAAFEICDRAVQLHGAMGFLEPFGVARMLRDSRITRIFEGANDVLLVRAGTELFARRAEVSAPGSLANQVAPELVPVAKGWDEMRGRLGEALERGRTAFGLRVVRHQILLQRLARAAICLRAAAAAMARATAESSADVWLAERATATLLDDAAGHIARAQAADDDEAVATKVSDRLYGKEGPQ